MSAITAVGDYAYTATLMSSRRGAGTLEASLTTEGNTRTAHKAVAYEDGTTLEKTRKVTRNDDGSRTIVASRTVNGETVTREVTGVRGENGARTYSGTLVTSDGDVVALSGARVRNEDGSSTVTRTRTDAEGHVSTREITLTSAEDGAKNYTGTVTRANGRVYEIAGESEKTDEGRVTVKTATNGKGEEASRTITHSHDGDTYTRTVSTVGFDGTVHERTITKKVNITV
jgi:hypothetical protein